MKVFFKKIYLQTEWCFVSLLLFLTNVHPAIAQVTIQNPLGENSTISSVILNISNGVFNLAAAIAAVVIGIGAFQYLFSFGSEDKIKQAKSTLWYAVIGIIVTLVGKSIVLLIQSILR